MKTTLHTLPVDGGPFNCQPARVIELPEKQVLCNQIILPWEPNPCRVRLWLVGHEHGPLGAAWADCEQDALDELFDQGLLDCLVIEDPLPEDEKDNTRLGNEGVLCDTCNVWMQPVRLDEAQDVRLLCAFAEARGNGNDTLDS